MKQPMVGKKQKTKGIMNSLINRPMIILFAQKEEGKHHSRCCFRISQSEIGKGKGRFRHGLPNSLLYYKYLQFRSAGKRSLYEVELSEALRDSNRYRKREKEILTAHQS